MPEDQPNAEMFAKIARLNKENKQLHDLLDHGGNLPPEIFEARKKGAADLAALLANGETGAHYAVIKATVLDKFRFLDSETLEPASVRDTIKKYGGPMLIPGYYSRKGVAVHIEIFFDGVPSNALKPLNDRAKAVFDAWSRSVTPYDKPAISRGDYTIPKPGRIEYHPPKRRFGLHKRAAIWAASKIARLRAWWKGQRRARMLATMYDNPRSAARREER